MSGPARPRRVAAYLVEFNASCPKLPIEPIFIILGIDELMDMARTSVNVIGNCLATVVMARREGEFGKAHPSEAVSESIPY